MEQNFNFIGKNIRFFRRSRNWTLVQLASKIGIREGPLGRIERGLNLPSAAVIYKLTKVLNVSADALFAHEISHVQATLDNNESFFVTIDSQPEAPPKNLLNACREIMVAFHALEDICKVQKHAYLPLSIPFKPDYNGMDSLAGRVRNYLGTSDAVVFDYFELFENFGLRIILFPFVRDSKNLASISFYEPAFHNAFFFLNSRNNPEKQLFSLALELGKILIFNQMRLRKDSLFPACPENTEHKENTKNKGYPEPSKQLDRLGYTEHPEYLKHQRSAEDHQGYTENNKYQEKLNDLKRDFAKQKSNTKTLEEKRPINENRAAKRFAATFLMPEKAVRATVCQLGISSDTWSWDLLVRIKHRFGISTESFLYRLDELELISENLLEKFKNKIKAFYDKTKYSEPDATRRCLTPNGRFFDLLLTAETIDGAEKEVADIKKTVESYKIIIK